MRRADSIRHTASTARRTCEGSAALSRNRSVLAARPSRLRLLGGCHAADPCTRDNCRAQAGGAKSSGPNTFNTSASPSHSGHRSRCSFMNRLVHSTASSLDRTS